MTNRPAGGARSQIRTHPKARPADSYYAGFCPLWGDAEEWRQCPSLPLYEISSYGRVRGPRRVLVLRIVKGYVFAGVCIGGRKATRAVSRLLAEAFHGPPPTPQHQAAHRDGDRLHNRPGNIRWLTGLENVGEKLIHGTAQIGEKHGMAILTVEEVADMRAIYAEHMRARRCAGFVRARRTFRSDMAAQFRISEDVLKDAIYGRSLRA